MSKSSGGESVTKSDVPAKYKGFGDETLTLAATASNMPYVNYNGPRLAGETQDQAGAFDYMKNSADALGKMRLGDGVAAEVANSGVGDVTRLTNDELMRTNDMLNRDTRSGVEMAGGGTGIRGKFLEAENNRNLMDAIARSTAQIGFQGQNLKLGAADRMRAAADSALTRDANIGNTLLGIGNIKQGQEQKSLDLAYSDFLDNQNHPLRMLALRQSALGMTPMGTVMRGPKSGGGMDIGGTLGGVGSLMTGMAAICWAARAVYGENSSEWRLFRKWMLSHAPAALRGKYLARGANLATRIRNLPEVRESLREAMDFILNEEMEYGRAA